MEAILRLNSVHEVDIRGADFCMDRFRRITPLPVRQIFVDVFKIWGETKPMPMLNDRNYEQYVECMATMPQLRMIRLPCHGEFFNWWTKSSIKDYPYNEDFVDMLRLMATRLTTVRTIHLYVRSQILRSCGIYRSCGMFEMLCQLDRIESIHMQRQLGPWGEQFEAELAASGVGHMMKWTRETFHGDDVILKLKVL